MLRNQENPLIRLIMVQTMWQIRGCILCNDGGNVGRYVVQGERRCKRGECRCTGGRHAGLPLHRNVGMMTDRRGGRIGGVGGVAGNAPD